MAYYSGSPYGSGIKHRRTQKGQEVEFEAHNSHGFPDWRGISRILDIDSFSFFIFLIISPGDELAWNSVGDGFLKSHVM